MPKAKSEERHHIRSVVERHTNEIHGYEDITRKMRENIVSLASVYEVTESYPLEKMAKMYAEPIYYLRKSLEHQMGVNADSLIGLSKEELKGAREKRNRIVEKLDNQVERQFRFWSTFLSDVNNLPK
jgi:hypothetical protein